MIIGQPLIFFVYVRLLGFTLVNASFNQSQRSTDETTLIQSLLNERTYLKKVRPSNKVIVDIRLIFNQIISMVEKEQIIVTNCFVDQKWTDPRLVWNPADFHNITWLRVPATYIWYPDTFLYNTADNAGFLLPQESQNMIVSFNGTVFWPLPLAQLRTRCRMTIKHFPFDEQTCDMVLGSWSHTSSLIHYQFWENQPEIPQYIPNNEWKLLAVTQSIKTVAYPNWVEPDPFFEVNFSLLIVRKPLQAIYNTVVPALMLTTLTLVSFFIPFAQEMQIGISIMLAYSVFSLRLSEDVPSQSDSVHLISLYLTVCMFFSLSAMTWFAIVNKLREKKRLPYCLRWLALNYFSWVVCASSMHQKAVRLKKQETNKSSPVTPSTPVIVPLRPLSTKQVNSNPIEYSNNYYFERESISTLMSSKHPLLSNKNQQKSSDIDMNNRKSIVNLVPFDQNSSNDDSNVERRQSTSSNVWVRRRNTSAPSPPASLMNGPTTKQNAPTKSPPHITKIFKEESPNRIKESLYAIHIYNRLVFLLFLLVVIVINIYMWFFYSRSRKSKLLDEETSWTCYDESILSIVNCSYLL